MNAGQNIAAWILCAAFFAALGYAIYLTPAWGAVLGEWWVSTFEATP